MVQSQKVITFLLLLDVKQENVMSQLLKSIDFDLHDEQKELHPVHITCTGLFSRIASVHTALDSGCCRLLLSKPFPLQKMGWRQTWRR